MKVTSGIVRRVDELGRVVIPKEMRRTLRIKEGEEMEVLVKSESEILLRKYSAVKALSDFADELVESLYSVAACSALICDTGEITHAATEKQTYLNRPISDFLDRALRQRKAVYLPDQNVKLSDDAPAYKHTVIAPIIFKGDVAGGVILASNTNLNENCKKLAELTADILAKQF